MAGEDRETFFPLPPCSRKGGGERAREVTEGKRGKGARPGLRPLPGEERQREGGDGFLQIPAAEKKEETSQWEEEVQGGFP